MINNLPYSPNHSVKWLENFFKADYYKKPYDRFMWWRSYTPKSKPLTNRHPFRDRILNGDFDLAPYKFEAELVEHRMNQKYIEHKGYEDTWREEIAVDKARRKRLLEDYEKEEHKRLEELKKCFLQEFKMTSKQYDREVVNTRAKDLIDFYYRMDDKFGRKAKKVQPVPKFR